MNEEIRKHEIPENEMEHVTGGVCINAKHGSIEGIDININTSSNNIEEAANSLKTNDGLAINLKFKGRTVF